MLSASKTCRLCVLNLIQWIWTQCFWQLPPPWSKLRHCRKTLRWGPLFQEKTIRDDKKWLTTSRSSPWPSWKSISCTRSINCRLLRSELNMKKGTACSNQEKPGGFRLLGIISVNNIQRAQHIYEMLRISISDMNLAFDKLWIGNKGNPFNFPALES